MKNVLFLFFGVFSLAVVNAQELKTHNDSLSYAVGVLWGQNLSQQGLGDINPDLIKAALTSILSEQKPVMDPQAANEMIKKHFAKQKEVQDAKAKEAGKVNIEAGKKFLADNAKRKGVITLPSGLQYEVIKEGTGPKPTPADKVNVHYHGTLIDGTVFDSSVERGEPISFPVTGVISGWVEALQLMPVGSKWKLFIPENLAYGDRGAGPTIGPYSTLIFEVELLGIE